MVVTYFNTLSSFAAKVELKRDDQAWWVDIISFCKKLLGVSAEIKKTSRSDCCFSK